MAEKNPIVTLEVADYEPIKIELYPEIAPNTVNNFISLVNQGFYNGLTFHRIIKGFMIQGGCPDGNGTGGPDYSIKGEFSGNGFKNDLKHTAGKPLQWRSSGNQSGASYGIGALSSCGGRNDGYSRYHQHVPEHSALCAGVCICR